MPYSYSEKKGRHLYCLLMIFVLLLSLSLASQVRWDGEGGDGQWNNAANWTGNMLPSVTDDVLLDNNFVSGNYTVTLPIASAVSIRTLHLTPATGNMIRLEILPTSTITPAFTVTGPGYGLTIDNGGVFVNASGATSSSAIAVRDSLRINNGGQYIHRTRTTHAAMVSLLSKQQGTENGIFTFNVPGGGYTIASTNRTYGTLVLSSEASGGSQSYATTAANPFTINGNLVIENGVILNLNVNAATRINGHLMQEGGVFNLASQANKNTIFIKGNCIQTAGSITETGSGLPTIELNGTNNQDVQIASISNNVAMRVNNSAGVSLLADLSLPYQLQLVNGTINNPSFLLTLQAGCSLVADSLPNNRFINGTLKKEGLLGNEHFLFPIGKGSTKRWIALKNVTGNITAAFVKSNPAALATAPVNGIHHTSSIEYWSVKADTVSLTPAKIELSFDNVNSGGVTDLAALRVAQMVGGAWTESGNTATSGSAGAAGSVVSNDLPAFGTIDYFTLASSLAFQNPLPLDLLSMDVNATINGVIVNWEIAASSQAVHFALQTSSDDLRYTTIAHIDAQHNQVLYNYTDKKVLTGSRYYRLQMIDKDSTISYSKKMIVGIDAVAVNPVRLWPSPVRSNATLSVQGHATSAARVGIYNMRGQLIQTKEVWLAKGINNISLQLAALPAGAYVLRLTSHVQQFASLQFIKTP